MFRHFEFALLKADYNVTVFRQLNSEWQIFAADMRPFLVWRMCRGCIESIYREYRVGLVKNWYGSGQVRSDHTGRDRKCLIKSG